MPADKPPGAAGSPNRIVIVDDDHTVRFILRRELMKRERVSARWSVATAATPMDGLALVRASEPGRPLVVIADYDLRAPTNGADLLEEVRASHPEATCVLMSGRIRDALAGEIERVKPRAYLEKPARLSDLVDEMLPILTEAAGAWGSEQGGEAAAVAPESAHDRGPDAIDPEIYRALVESMSEVGVAMLDPDGRVRTWSRGAARLHGYAEDEILGEDVEVLYAQTDAVNHKARFDLRVAIQDGRLEETAWRVRKDGSMFWAHVVFTAIRGDDGDLVGLSLVTRDLTDRWHHEEALRQSEERHRRMVESVKDYAIFQLDASGRIASWNEGAQRIKGYTADEAVGTHFSRFYTPEDRARARPQEGLRRAVANGRFTDEGWRVRNDGSRFWASVVITPLFGTDGHLRGFAKVTRDLTERRMHEEALRQRASQLATLARELETFNYTVAHDLRSPLRAVTHLTETLLSEDEVSEAERRELLETVHTSAVRMGQLVDDLFALSRVTRGELVRETVDVTRLARDVVEQLMARSRSSRADVRIASDLVADADPRLLRVVLENLVSNALKFSAGVPHPVVEVGRSESRDGAGFFVRDNGVGFDDAHADGLFQPFRRLHQGSDFEGSGIGLATVARIVERHGGRVWAEAAPGEGATFHFTLGDGSSPAASSDAGTASAAEES